MDIYKRIYELENEIAALPQGSINMKKIYGKEQPYLQWTENGKSKSKYIKKNEREEIFAGEDIREENYIQKSEDNLIRIAKDSKYKIK